jgi:thiol:disulfide interchange protein DsbD
MTLIVALAFAFIGGLILNLMPCVFPVLGIKVMGFVQHAQKDNALLKQQGFAFFAGVVISFWILSGLLLALRAAGESIGWGFQLQSPIFVTLLAVLFSLMALNLSGVFEMGLRLQSAAGNVEMRGGRSTLVDAFLSGVLATIVATPCTAPFMGAALGFTLSQPAYMSMLVFTAIAIGMALPVTLLSLVPRWLAYLPKPGAWMTTFKQFMAFPLLATVVWLAWVLGSQQGNDGIAKLLFGLVLISLAAWLYGRWQSAKPMLAVVVGAAVAAGGLALAWPSEEGTREVVAGAAAKDDWVPFSKQKIADLRAAGKGVFVDFTATWCITCQVNKRVALNQADVVKRFMELNIVRMKADWTVKDPAITAALAEFGRNGVPLYVFYPPKGEAMVLPEVLTPSVVLSHVESTATRTAQR